MLDAQWRPAPRGAFADRPQSPERLAAVAKGEASTEAPTKPSLRAATPARRRRDRPRPPPAKFSLARDEDDKPGKIRSGPGRSSLPPGAEFIAGGGNVKAASKNAKRRAKKKTAGAGGSEDPEGEGPEGGEEAAEEAAAAVASTSLQDSQPAAASGPLDEEARQKRVRALQKKLRQIQELKDKQAAQGDKPLTPEQLEKLSGEKALLDELASLGA
ncbi:hypothetical protein GPECTOR_1447g639 [Gonium pectorale]|uniref:WIBG Mago-binding domain-containing protein n=1 Tax=Gonium pectorale TaxID=33097 RepID=A0A150FTJ3_GONPE|nr:hypothetical protein GPECTOR_1447g639 [Gonium pectorale]|eukprot:KXZ40898.1 hypothetical protein GPECTOR_1447g639 [Gonium pectorale]